MEYEESTNVMYLIVKSFKECCSKRHQE